jgi:thiamine-phosphate pyrophosphorylase
LRRLVAALADAGITLLQYRNKQDSDVLVAQDALAMLTELRSAESGSRMKLILNDRLALVPASGWDGVHLGQDDGSAAGARHLLGPDASIGVSTHNEEQVRRADEQPVDYIAIGPVFRTISKTDTSPVIGLEGVAQARRLTRKPLVAIGGITLENAASVYAAGADSLAVIAAIFSAGGTPARAARDFLAIFE